jgi:hypothetical protein
MPIAFKIGLGGLDIGSAKTSAQLLRLRVELTMDGAGGRSSVVLAATDFATPKLADKLTISLDGGDGSVDVFTGEVDGVTATADEVRVTATDGLSKLGRLEFDEVFEKQTAGKIVRAILDAAGLTAGTVADGPAFPSYVLHRGPRALQHLQRLAEQCGVDVFTDGAGKVHFAGPDKAGKSHTFRAREHILAMRLDRVTPGHDGVVVWGEGAAGTKGEAKSHWLADDLAGVSGKAAVGADGKAQKGSAGKRPRSVFDGAVRTGQVAGDLAAARALACASRQIRGHIEVLGAPAVVPGDTVKLDNFSDGMHAIKDLAGDAGLRVRLVRHSLDADSFITRMEFG